MESTTALPGESQPDSEFGTLAQIYRLRMKLREASDRTAAARINADYWAAMVGACEDVENKADEELRAVLPRNTFVTETVSGSAAVDIGSMPVEFGPPIRYPDQDSADCECERWRNGISVCPMHRVVKGPAQFIDARKLNASGLCGTCGTEFTPACQPVNVGMYWVCPECDKLVQMESP